MRWPIMLKRTHDRVVTALRERYQAKVDAEYSRARDEGRRQVHAWAVEVNANIFYGSSPWQGTERMRVTAALQEAEHKFTPTRTRLEAPKEN